MTNAAKPVPRGQRFSRVKVNRNVPAQIVAIMAESAWLVPRTGQACCQEWDHEIVMATADQRAQQIAVAKVECERVSVDLPEGVCFRTSVHEPPAVVNLEPIAAATWPVPLWGTVAVAMELATVDVAAADCSETECSETECWDPAIGWAACRAA